MTMAEFAPLQPSKKVAAWRPSGGLLPRVAAALTLSLFSPRLPAQPRPSQYDVEAAYVLNFGKFTQLSASSQAPGRSTYDICIVGQDTIGPAVEKLAASDTIQGRAVRVLRGLDASRARACDIVFIGTHAGDAIRQDLENLSGAGVLTVGDSPEFLDDGGMIQFVVENSHVRFAVNLNAVRGARLVLSSQLLRVALWVEGEPKPEAAP